MRQQNDPIGTRRCRCCGQIIPRSQDQALEDLEEWARQKGREAADKLSPTQPEDPTEVP